MRHFSEYPPLTLYVHFPWCVRKCPYCDFNSHAVRDSIPEREYLDAVVSDLEQHAPDIWGRPVDSVFFGGGTPSLISASGLDFLLGKIRAIVKLEPSAEITLEANPGAVEQQRFADYRDAGINRLSIGVQSFNNQHLEALGRIHSGEEAIIACNSAINAGFDNFNLDLMHGLPGQDLTQALSDVDTAVSLNPTHISYYQLTIEPNTLFAVTPPELPAEETWWDIQEQGKKKLSDAGYQQYEVSAYAQPGKQCRHNLNYWLFGDYLGIGAGAHSKLSFPANNSIIRHAKRRQPADYMKHAAGAGRIQTSNAVEPGDARLEFMMNALRLNSGFSTADFQRRCGELIGTIRAELDEAEKEGLICITHNHITPTAQGSRFLDSLLEKFMPATHAATAVNTNQQEWSPGRSATNSGGIIIPIHHTD